MIIGQALISGLLMGLVFALVALGLTIIFGVMDIVNFAHGEFLMVGMYAGYLTSSQLGVDPLVGIPVAAVVGFILGIFSYYTLIRRLLKGPMIAQLFGTFGLMLFLRYLAMFIFGPNYKTLFEGLLVGKSISILGTLTINLPKLVSGVFSIFLFLLIYWMLHRTKLGMSLRATSIHTEAAQYMGVNTEKMNALAWGIGGATVGIAGALLVNFYYVYPTIGLLFTMIAFASVALGGFGSIMGAFVAGVIIGLIMVLSGQFISSELKLSFVYATYFLVVLLRPQGLFGEKSQ